jgi:hypothetical protein
MELVDFDNLSDVLSSDTPPRSRGRPAKVIDLFNASFAQRNHELTVMLGFAEDERLELVATVREQEKALVALSSSIREMDYLKMKAAALEEKIPQQLINRWKHNNKFTQQWRRRVSRVNF